MSNLVWLEILGLSNLLMNDLLLFFRCSLLFVLVFATSLLFVIVLCVLMMSVAVTLSIIVVMAFISLWIILTVCVILVRPIKCSVFTDHLFYLIFLWGINPPLSQKSVMSIVDYVLHIQHIANCLEYIWRLFRIQGVQSWSWTGRQLTSIASLSPTGTIELRVIHERPIAKGNCLSDGGKHHLNRDDQWLSKLRSVSVEQVHFKEEGKCASLPERKEQYRLDAKEFWEWIEGLQSLLSSHVKKHKAVQR